VNRGPAALGKLPGAGLLNKQTNCSSRSAARGTIAVFTERLNVLRTRIGIAAKLLASKPVTIRLFGDDHCLEVYRTFTAPHPKFPLVQRKSFGVALRDLDVPLERIFDGPRFAHFRRKVRRAERAGYCVARLDPRQYLDQIMHIHKSSTTRQGRAMQATYLDLQKVMDYLAKPGRWYGVLDRSGVLRAYCHLPIIGECCYYSRILGDAQRLGDGIMYLLVDRTIREMHHCRGRDGYPRWVMYDMFLGGTEGLRTFKIRSGFCPERVAWLWSPC